MIEKSDMFPGHAVPRSTVEQWAVLRAVIDAGGFAAAAAALNRSQSTVSYAMARLRDAVGVDLLRIEGRRAVLTPEGATLLAEAMPLIDDLRRIERRGAGAAHGDRLQIRLLVDTLFPRMRLFRAIDRFSHERPHVSIDLRETVRLRARDADPEGHDLAILVAAPGTDAADVIARVDLVAVARHDHPLIGSAPAPTSAALARHPRIEIHGLETDEGPRPAEGRVWRMNTMEAAADAVRLGLCYGWLPRHLIDHDLNIGRLALIPLAAGGTRSYPLAVTSPVPAYKTDRTIAAFLRSLFEQT